MLESLKAKRLGASKVSPTYPTTPLSPDRTILVPQSSSPAGQSPVSRLPQTNGNGNRNIIPSSNLSRNGNGMPQKPSGSPEAVMKAMTARRDEGSRTNGSVATSLSYEPTKPVVATLDNLFDSPSQPATPSTVPDTVSPTLKRTPSLIAAAQATRPGGTPPQGQEGFIARALAQYRNVNRAQVLKLLAQYPNHRTRVFEGLRALDSGVPVASTSSLASSPLSSVPSSVPKPAASMHTPVPKPVVTQSKPKKNENSALYAKRGSNGRKRSASGSESEGQMSEAESEVEWSDEGGPRRKKRKNEDVMDPETVALNAFNTQTAEGLTGTIGRSRGFLY